MKHKKPLIKKEQPFWKKHLPFMLLFALLIVTGVSTYKDYGLSWDEAITRDDNGLVNYKYIVEGDYETLKNNDEKYHGPFFEILLVIIEKAARFTDTRDIFLMRHLVNFLTFCLSIFFFYLICCKYFKNILIGILGCAFLILSPRIYADSFYNSKDLIFLSAFIISMYTSLRFAELKNIPTAIWHALSCAILIDIRVVGILVPVFSCGMVAYDLLLTKLTERRKLLLSTSIYLVLLVGFIVLFWPVMWREPLANFMAALHEMSRYPWKGNVLYMGKFIKADELPWHYLPRWIVLTTPLLYTLLFVAGIILILFDFMKKQVLSSTLKFYTFCMYSVFVPLLVTLVLGSVVYDAWRHLFFIYPAFLLIGLVTLDKVFTVLKKKLLMKGALIGILMISMAFTFYSMVELHPYQNVYFSILAGDNMNAIKRKYEIDYWGLTYRKGLEFILSHDTASVIKVCPAHYPGLSNSYLLPAAQRARLHYVYNPKKADYFIGNFRMRPEGYGYGEEVFSIKAGNAKLLVVESLKY